MINIAHNEDLYIEAIKSLIKNNGEYIKINTIKKPVSFVSGDSVLGGYTGYVGSLKTEIPNYLQEKYVKKCLPVESHTWGADANKLWLVNPGARFEPYDAWIICMEEEFRVKKNKYIFDYVDYITFRDLNYKVKGKIEERKKLLHVFLQRTET